MITDECEEVVIKQNKHIKFAGEELFIIGESISGSGEEALDRQCAQTYELCDEIPETGDTPCTSKAREINIDDQFSDVSFEEHEHENIEEEIESDDGQNTQRMRSLKSLGIKCRI